MKYNENAKVPPAIEEEAREHITSLDNYLSKMKGTLISLESISYSSGAYADTVEGFRLSLYQPNAKTTNAPIARLINKSSARLIIEALLGPVVYAENAEWHQKRIETLHPAPDPVGLGSRHKASEALSCCWVFTVVTPSTE